MKTLEELRGEMKTLEELRGEMKTLEELRGEIWKDGALNVGKLCAFCDRLESEIERLKAKRKTDIAAAFVAGRSKKRWIDWLAEYEKEKKMSEEIKPDGYVQHPPGTPPRRYHGDISSSSFITVHEKPQTDRVGWPQYPVNIIEHDKWKALMSLLEKFRGVLEMGGKVTGDVWLKELDAIMGEK